MKKRRQKRFQEMTTAELRQATKEFDREFIADKARPMNAAERARNRQLRRRRGRPRIGKGAEKINICLERDLLASVNRLAKEQGIRRSTLIAQALASVVGRKAG
ncbi:MAG: hypothetical protein ABSB33_04985 [Tepidisphaeraceae bacterium]|jgi:hypothetical protein